MYGDRRLAMGLFRYVKSWLLMGWRRALSTQINAQSLRAVCTQGACPDGWRTRFMYVRRVQGAALARTPNLSKWFSRTPLLAHIAHA
jgi:hypothetical protein